MTGGGDGWVVGFLFRWFLLADLCTFEGLAESPVCICNTRCCDSAIACGDHEPNALPHELPTTLPVLSPVPCHGVPSCVIPSHPHRHHDSRSTHVGDRHQVEKRVPVDGEPDSSCLDTIDPGQQEARKIPTRA